MEVTTHSPQAEKDPHGGTNEAQSDHGYRGDTEEAGGSAEAPQPNVTGQGRRSKPHPSQHPYRGALQPRLIPDVAPCRVRRDSRGGGALTVRELSPWTKALTSSHFCVLLRGCGDDDEGSPIRVTLWPRSGTFSSVTSRRGSSLSRKSKTSCVNSRHSSKDAEC